MVGLGLLGGAVALSAARRMPWVRLRGYAHRASTRRKATRLEVFESVTGSLRRCIADSELVILATPVGAFPTLLERMAPELPPGCVVTDVGSTKVWPHRWARVLDRANPFVGSHPMAGSEQRGLDYARDDLLEGAWTLVTRDASAPRCAVDRVAGLWQALGCRTEVLSPAAHDRLVAAVSHVPHVAATALVNATASRDLWAAGRGFLDTTRVASGPAALWADILLTNPEHVTRGIDRLVAELEKVKAAVAQGHRPRLERLLDRGADRRGAWIREQLQGKELLK